MEKIFRNKLGSVQKIQPVSVDFHKENVLKSGFRLGRNRSDMVFPSLHSNHDDSYYDKKSLTVVSIVVKLN